MIKKEILDKTSAWPFVEAKKMLRERKSLIDKKEKQVFEFEDIKEIVIQEYRRRSRDEILSSLLKDLTLRADIKINSNLD